MKTKKVQKKLSLKKETVDNLELGSMEEAKGAGRCQYPTRPDYDCYTMPPSVYTCGHGSCMCMSIVPV